MGFSPCCFSLLLFVAVLVRALGAGDHLREFDLVNIRDGLEHLKGGVPLPVLHLTFVSRIAADLVSHVRDA